ncbi:histone-lysine N-methyltransferase SETMAR [Trichonephila clavipes]|nr:histone-lysine N-methyltransferase SETMAR [Trichonephila clavipes]
MGIPYYPGVKATVDGMAKQILSRLSQNQTNAVKTQDYGKGVLGPVLCFAGGLNATRNNDQLMCLLPNPTEAPKSIAKQTVKCVMLSKCVLLHQDNSRPHTSRTTRDLIESLGCEVLDNVPYISDLAPSDFHLFLYLKHSLGGKRFSKYEEVKAAVNFWLSDQAVDFFGFQN